MNYDVFPGQEPMMTGLPGGIAGNFIFNNSLHAAQAQGLMPSFSPVHYSGMNAVQAYDSQRFFQDYNQGMAQASLVQSAAMADQMSGLLYSAGVQPNQQVQTGINNFAAMLGQFATPFLMASPGGRDFLEMAYGGKPESVLAMAYQGMSRNMHDPVTGLYGMQGNSAIAIGGSIASSLTGVDPASMIPGQVYANPMGSLSANDMAKGMGFMHRRGMLGESGIGDALGNREYMETIRERGFGGSYNTGPSALESSLGSLAELGINSQQDFEAYQERARERQFEANSYRRSRTNLVEEETAASRETLLESTKKFKSGAELDAISISPLETIKRALALGVATGGTAALQDKDAAADMKAANDALASGDMNAFNATSIGKSFQTNDAATADRLSVAVAAAGSLSPEEVKNIIKTNNVGQINASAGVINRSDPFGIDTRSTFDGLSSSPEADIDQIVQNESAMRQGDTMVKFAKNMAAVKDLLKSQGYSDLMIASMNLGEEVEKLAAGGLHQIDYSRMDSYARSMATLGTRMNYSAAEMQAVTGMASQITSARGQEAALTPEVTQSMLITGAAMQQANYGALRIFGGSSIEQFQTQAGNLTSAYIDSQEGQSAGGMMSLYKRHGAQENAAGAKLKRAMEASRRGEDSPEMTELLSMSEQERIQFMAEATGVGTGTARSAMENSMGARQQFAQEGGMNLMGGTRQAREVFAQAADAMERGVSASLEGSRFNLTAEQRGNVSAMLASSIASSLKEADASTVAAMTQGNDMTFANTAAKRMMENTKRAAAAGNQGASALLSSMSEDELMDHFRREVVTSGIDTYSTDTGKAVTDDVQAFGDVTAGNKAEVLADTQVKNIVAELMSGQNSTGFKGLAKALGQAGRNGEGMTATELFGSYIGTDVSGNLAKQLKGLDASLASIQSNYSDERDKIIASGLGSAEQTSRLEELDKAFDNQRQAILESAMGAKGDKTSLLSSLYDNVKTVEEKEAEKARVEKEQKEGAADQAKNAVFNIIELILEGETVAKNVKGSAPSKGGTVEDSGSN